MTSAIPGIPARPAADVAARRRGPNAVTGLRGPNAVTGLRGPNAVTGLGTVLGIWAHPDDEAYLSGGLMAAAVAAGARVVCVTATRGERGTDDPGAWPPARLAAVREAELGASLAALGVTEHHFLGCPDGRCAELPAAEVAEAVEALAGIVADVRPDTVVTFGPDGFTGHPDHCAISDWAVSAVRQAGLAGCTPRLLHPATTARWCERFESLHIELGIFEPGLPPRVPADEVAVDLVLPDDLLDRKVAALRAHASQVVPLLDLMGEDRFRAWVGNELFRAGPDVAAEAG